MTTSIPYLYWFLLKERSHLCRLLIVTFRCLVLNCLRVVTYLTLHRVLLQRTLNNLLTLHYLFMNHSGPRWLAQMKGIPSCCDLMLFLWGNMSPLLIAHCISFTLWWLMIIVFITNGKIKCLKILCAKSNYAQIFRSINYFNCETERDNSRIKSRRVNRLLYFLGIKNKMSHILKCRVSWQFGALCELFLSFLCACDYLWSNYSSNLLLIQKLSRNIIRLMENWWKHSWNK